MNHPISRPRSALGVGEAWTAADATELYEISRWGKGYFSIGDNGQVKIHPTKDASRSIDLKQLVDDLRLRGIRVPTLIRFRDVLQHRLKDIYEAFQAAIAQHDYSGRYVCVYPIKVNQQRQVVEEVLAFGRPYRFGLEAGSKPELLAVVALASNETPIICNGFKDAEFIEMAMMAQKIGRRVIPVVEKYTELHLILEYAKKVGVRPVIGMRVKLAARGGGRWQSSGGFRSKFGLTVAEILRGLEELKQRGMEDCFQLLHFHLGSQIPNIRVVKGALNEAARVYVELVKAGAGLLYMDVGGGLGVDYDGSQTNFESSVNYTLEEYANDVVYHLQTVCDEAKVPHPTIVSERGRELPRRAAGAGHGDESVLGRLSAARSAVAGRESLLGDLPQAAEAGAGDGRGPRGSPEPRRVVVGYLLLQLLAVPVHSRLLGHQAALSDHADSPAERTAHPARRPWRHHLRLRRQDRSVHRPAGYQACAAAAWIRRIALLPRRLSGRRLPGDPRRSAQPAGRYARRARQPRRERRGRAGRRDQGRHGP